MLTSSENRWTCTLKVGNEIRDNNSLTIVVLWLETAMFLRAVAHYPGRLGRGVAEHT